MIINEISANAHWYRIPIFVHKRNANKNIVNKKNLLSYDTFQCSNFFKRNGAKVNPSTPNCFSSLELLLTAEFKI